MILDTNAVSALADGSTALLRVVEQVRTFALPVIALGEFRFGIAQSRHARRYREWIDRLAGVSRLLDVDEATSRTYAEIRLELRRRGRPIPSNDVWIAALAIQHGLPVLSRDGHFDEVERVERIAW